MAMSGILANGLPPGLDTFVLRQQEMQQKRANDLREMTGVLSMQGMLAKYDAAAQEMAARRNLAAQIQGSGLPNAGVLSLQALLEPKAVLPYIAQKKEAYSLSPGQRRYGPDNQILATAPKIDMVNRGDRFEAVDLTQTQPGDQLGINVAPNTVFTQDALDARHDRASASTIYGQDQQNSRQGREHDLRRELHRTPSGTSQQYGRGAGVFRLPNGSTVSRGQLMQQYKVENNLLDPFQISMYENSTDPAMKALGQRERQRLNNAVPFDQWASSKFGVDVYGAVQGEMPTDMEVAPGFGPLPAPAPQPPRLGPGAPGAVQPPMFPGAGPTMGGGNSPGGGAPQAPRMGEVRKTLNGVNYVKRNGRWFQE